jgi:predicted nucleic acid-binding protein
MNQILKNVVLDTATLVPATLRDTLLRTVDKRLFIVYWSEDTIIELRRTLVQKLKIQTSNVAYLIQEMQKHFPYATVPTQQ